MAVVKFYRCMEHAYSQQERSTSDTVELYLL